MWILQDLEDLPAGPSVRQPSSSSCSVRTHPGGPTCVHSCKVAEFLLVVLRRRFCLSPYICVCPLKQASQILSSMQRHAAPQSVSPRRSSRCQLFPLANSPSALIRSWGHAWGRICFRKLLRKVIQPNKGAQGHMNSGLGLLRIGRFQVCDLGLECVTRVEVRVV